MRLRRIRHDIVDSTNERALAAIEDGSARHGDLHLASGQTRGRGRLGRSWVSADGEGLYASVVLLPVRLVLPAALTLAGGLAMHDAVRALGLARARLDWPNDLVVGDAKLSGVLAETRGLTRERPGYVLGMGLNVAQIGFPPELLRERQVTSLRLQGLRASVQDAERALLAHLPLRMQQAMDDLAGLARDFLGASGLAPGRVDLDSGGGTQRVSLHALELERGALVETADGRSWVRLERIRSLRPATL